MLNTLGGQHLDRFDEPGSGVVERLVGHRHTVGVNDADGEVVLVRVDARDCRCHAVLLLEVMIPVVRDRQERFVRSESS
jgi:hypothetical protein